MTVALTAPTLDDIRDAQRRLRGLALRTPLVRLDVADVADAPEELWLKLECLQPIGSFKIRGGGYAMLAADPKTLARGVYTASAGNMAQGVAYLAREMGVPCTVVVPDHAPQAKLAAVERLGGRVVKVPFDRWWQVLVEHGYPGLDGLFVHPVSDRRVMAGNGTVALEILDELPGVDAILVPYGGGGLSVGIAAAVRALQPATAVYACEVETAAPLRASLAAGRAATCEYAPSFVDGIGGKSVLAEIWPLASALLDGALSASVAEVAAAVRLLVTRARVVPEGAGAAPVAAALKGVPNGERAAAGRVVCVVSGGNIDAAKLARILVGAMP
jgi:threonine dehydratase